MSTRSSAHRSTQQLTARQLNRATLARQLLLERERRSTAEVIEHLVGLQAQEPRDPYVALWSRLHGFQHSDLERLLLERQAARMPLMRATLHLASARDCRSLRGLLQPVMTRTQKGAFGRALAGADLDALAEFGRRFFADRPRSLAEFRAELAPEWSAFPATALGYSVSYLVPLVQTPPRGLWHASGQARWVTSESWLGPAQPDYPARQLVLRYLAAFGPASVMDIQAWCGLTHMQEIVESLRPDLVSFRSESGRELFDLPEAGRPHPDTPAPVRFLPEYDNLLLGHADRQRFAPDRLLGRPVATGELGVGSLLLDGVYAGAWKLFRDRHAVRLEVRPLGRLSSADEAAVEEEARALLEFLARDEPERELRFA